MARVPLHTHSNRAREVLSNISSQHRKLKDVVEVFREMQQLTDHRQHGSGTQILQGGHQFGAPPFVMAAASQQDCRGSHLLVLQAHGDLLLGSAGSTQAALDGEAQVEESSTLQQQI